MTYEPAARPTICFIGVTTAKSSIMKVFPAWAQHLGLRDAVIRGIDFPQGAVAWDLNYRGDLVFLDQARRQRAGRGLQVEDGWTVSCTAGRR